MALTLPTCQLRDSSSRRHLGYSGVLFTMQHSVQHKKKKFEKERERARVWEIWSIVLGSWDLWLHLIWEENVWISFGIPAEPAQMKFQMASGCEWEWVATCCKKAKHLQWMHWETCRHNFCVIGAVVTGNLRQMTAKTWCLPRENRGHPIIEIKRSWNMSTTKCRNENNELRWTMNNSQFCGPPTKEGTTRNVPLPQSATLSDMCVYGPIVYEWLDSVLRSQVHLLQQNALTGHHPLPLGARPGVRLR